MRCNEFFRIIKIAILIIGCFLPQIIIPAVASADQQPLRSQNILASSRDITPHEPRIVVTEEAIQTVAVGDFRMQLGGSFEMGDEEHYVLYKEHFKYQRWGVSGIYYFHPVQVRDFPLAEAAFLQRTSSIGANYTRCDYTEGRWWLDNSQNYALLGSLYISDFFLGAQVLHQYIDYYVHEEKETDWSASFGFLPAPGIKITTTYSDAWDGSWHLDAKFVRPIFTKNWLNLEAHMSFHKFTTIYQTKFDIYIDPTFSLGASLWHRDSDHGSSITDITVKTRKFFFSKFSVGLAYGYSKSWDIVYIDTAIRF